MDRDQFWKLIDDARVTAGSDDDEFLKELGQSLGEVSLDDVRAFQAHFDMLERESYSVELWGAAYMVNGGCSDDAFDYFRGWLISQGRAAFEAACGSPDALSGFGVKFGELEEMLSVAVDAYEERTGEEYPWDQDPKLGARPRLEFTFEFDDDAALKHHYPKLYKYRWGASE